jgi:hypothetical protein
VVATVITTSGEILCHTPLLSVVVVLICNFCPAGAFGLTVKPKSYLTWLPLLRLPTESTLGDVAIHIKLPGLGVNCSCRPVAPALVLTCWAMIVMVKLVPG